MWHYQGTEFNEVGDWIGFVYIITNRQNGRRYLGKKNFYFTRTKSVKGKRKRVRVESDWRDYYGSNKELLTDVEKCGKDSFHREIIRLCRSKGEFAYYEAKAQFEHDVLMSDDWYNTWICVRVHAKHLKKDT
jgi:hypothetical protein